MKVKLLDVLEAAACMVALLASVWVLELVGELLERAGK